MSVQTKKKEKKSKTTTPNYIHTRPDPLCLYHIVKRVLAVVFSVPLSEIQTRQINIISSMTFPGSYTQI